ncbi:MAG: penicillin-insensitive murein endopeptidase [Desulfobulbus sp.]|jgi:penicillin-insensitive murein endopeptidase|uniref:penicillin-insensitive murein endopeptidase n=1 Tax=Desulfobulbus sp. TaxID=895 RepID=UPI00283C7F69|nr:penicillin-insensitive murein endopeptidase [Desulfobulbus sp.]MDR2549580.1 penicillin-insensitive murein endopeptidase [Desulfobulbus sp.]
MKRKFTAIILILSCCQWAYAETTPSTCYGTTKDGRLKNGWQLPSSGKNFEADSSLGVFLGRNYVHSKVHAVVVAAYKMLESSAPGKMFVYGETGLEDGGRFRPHKTHANGLSVDFFVPVVNPAGVSVKLPMGPLNKFGYDIEFDRNAQYEDMTIDFEAMARHLLAIKQAADAHEVGISVIIFDNSFQEMLFASPTGKKLPALMRFSVKKPWVRHDEHYHVDFDVQCADGG